ncbi:MAG: DUF2975 domain-containing protein [Erythrobacter sp.]
MNLTKSDPLLAAAQLLLFFFIGVLGFCAALIAMSVPATLIFQDQILGEVASQGVPASPELIGALLMIFTCVFAMLVLGVCFMELLRRIVRTVGTGDPFIPENAKRLSRMGWIGVAAHLVILPLGGVAMWLMELVEDTPVAEDIRFDIDFGLDFSGILLVLILFILARVFRTGADMREDLEGTV